MKEKLINIWKKYWGVIVAVLGAIFVGAAVTKGSQNRKEARKIKKDIRNTEKDIDKVQDKAKVVAKENEVAKKKVKESEKRVDALKNEVKKPKKENKDVNKAVDHLKNL